MGSITTKLTITASNLPKNLIEELPSNLISGPIHEIVFVRCRIGVFRPFSVASIGDRLESLRMGESFVNRVERHAFKRFNANNILLEGSKFVAPISSQSFYEVDVQERFDIRNCSFYQLMPSAFTMKSEKSYDGLRQIVKLFFFCRRYAPTNPE